MNKVTRLYQDIIEEIKDKGYRVRHGKRRNDNATAACYHETKTIHMNLYFRNTLYGCYILGHELGHVCDYYDKTFPISANMPMSYIRKLEWSAIQFGKSILEDRGFKVNHWEDFNKKYFEKDLREWWFPYYNGKKYEKAKKRNNRSA